MKILVVDDEDDIRRIAALALGPVGGMTVIQASNGVEAVRKATEELPDVILLDMMMPDMDGPTTFTTLKNQPATSGIPIIFLTAKAMKTEVDRLKAMGARAVLTKPFDPTSLAAQIRKVLEDE